MLFNSLKYLIFLPIVVALYWAVPKRFKVPLLLIASYIFYMSWRPAFIILIIGLTVINYFLGFAIFKSEKHKKGWLTLAVAANLSTLAFFKYAYFLDDLAAGILHPLGVTVPKVGFSIVLPLGISFFVFEFIHYVSDVYRGSEPIRSFLSFSLFASFFPTQIAGPIKRFQDFIPQFLSPAKFSIESFDEGIALILMGLFKKSLLADNLAFFVTGGFSQPQLFGGLDCWLFTLAFAFQIYFDFSGYTDIARGSALLFGYKVPINFNLPYIAANISDFWHRWHISLSTWLRDYLFIPLGGSRCSNLLCMRNLLLTMTLGGLWHGASLHYMVWGLYHGMLLIVHREFQKVRKSAGLLDAFVKSKVGRVASTLLTFVAVCVGWVLFRADTLDTAASMLQKMFTLAPVAQGLPSWQMALSGINYPLIYSTIYLLLPIYMVGHVAMDQVNKARLAQRAPLLVKAAWCAALVLAIMIFSPDKSPRFIYFQF